MALKSKFLFSSLRYIQKFILLTIPKFTLLINLQNNQQTWPNHRLCKYAFQGVAKKNNVPEVLIHVTCFAVSNPGVNPRKKMNVFVCVI